MAKSALSDINGLANVLCVAAHECQGLPAPVIPTSTGKTLARGNAQLRGKRAPFSGRNRADDDCVLREEFIDSYCGMGLR